MITTSLDKRGPFPPICVDESSLHEGERRQGKNGDEVTLRKVLHDLVLDVPDVSISPEHDSTKSDGLREGEEEIQGDHTT